MGLIERLRGLWLPKFAPLGGELDRVIESTAELVEDRPRFQARAMEVSDQFGPTSIPSLCRRLHRATAAPPGFTAEERGLACWLSYWQASIFEILYHFREQSLPTLRKVAFGVYDWTQANAIEVLCRLAAEGIARDRTIADLTREMPRMREEALFYAAQTLLQLAEVDPNLAAVVLELRRIKEFEAAVQEIRDNDEA